MTRRSRGIGQLSVSRRWRAPRPGRLALAGIATLALAVATACSGPGETKSETQADSELPAGVEPEDLVPVEGFTMVTTTPDDNASRYEAARVISKAWNELGIPVEVRPSSDAEMVRVAFTAKTYDSYLIEYAPTDARLDPTDFLGRFITSAAVKDGNNLSGYEDADFDDLFQTQLSAADDEDRLAAVQEAQVMLSEDRPIIMVAHPKYFGAHNVADWSGAVNAASGPGWNFWSVMGMEPTGDRSTLLVASQEVNATLNPVAAENFEDRIPITYLYDSLARIDEEGVPTPWAAEDIEHEGTTVTATMRSDMTFHDGEPVTAQDVAFSVNYLMEHQAPLFATTLEQVKTVRTQGDDVIFELTEPSSSFIPVALSAMPILPEHIWGDIDEPFTFENADPVGSGPFTFQRFKRDAEIRMERFDGHFAASPAEALVVTEYGNRDAMLGALETGSADLMTTPLTAPQAERFEGSDQIGILEQDGFGWLGVHVNMRKAPFDQPVFREALSLVTPRADVIDIVYDGGGVPAGSVIAPVLPWTESSVEPDPYDPELARSVLEEAGYLYLDGQLYYPPDHEK